MTLLYGETETDMYRKFIWMQYETLMRYIVWSSGDECVPYSKRISVHMTLPCVTNDAHRVHRPRRQPLSLQIHNHQLRQVFVHYT